MAVEYFRLNDPGDRGYGKQTEVTLNFLSPLTIGEPVYPFPDGLTPFLYHAVEEGRLIAAATLLEDSGRGKGQFLLHLMAVAEGRRGQGIGSELLEVVEKDAAQQLGALAINVDPFEAYGSDSPEKARSFYLAHGYDSHPEEEGLLTKVLPTADSGG